MLPLSRNADLSPKAKDLAAELRRNWNVEFDDSGAIGRRYRRQDEIGTPYCVTVDFDTLDDHAVTIRERDTMQQERIALDGIRRTSPSVSSVADRVLWRAVAHAVRTWSPRRRAAAVPAVSACRPSAVGAARGGGDAATEQRPRHGRRAVPPVPDGVVLTDPGSELELGEPATVAWRLTRPTVGVLASRSRKVVEAHLKALQSWQRRPAGRGRPAPLLRHGHRSQRR